jgi:hypothetical protein
MGVSIMATNCHFISEDWQNVTRTIGFETFPERHTGENIREKFATLLKFYGSDISNVSNNKQLSNQSTPAPLFFNKT